MSRNYRVRISRRKGSCSYRYFDTLDEALAYEHPPESDPFGYPRRKPRITIQANVDGILNKYQNVEGLATITFHRNRITVKI